jgi:hypothetical protein
MRTFILPIVSVFMLTSNLFAQTDPSPYNMNVNGNYSFTSWSPFSTAGTYPSNMVFHIMGPTAPVTTSSVATGNITGAYNHTNGTRINGLDADGISIVNQLTQTPSGYTANRNGEIVLALNTIARTNISLSFIAGTVTAGTGSAESKLRAQYRVHNGTSWGAWKDIAVTPVEYTSSTTIPSQQVFSPIVLPAEVNNQANVQIRWLYYYSTGTLNNGYKSPAVRLDNISVTSLPIVTHAAIDLMCSLDNSVPLSGGSPAGGHYSGTNVSANTFNASAAGSGNHNVTYTYTDSHGMTNSVSATVPVGIMACTTQLTTAYCGISNQSLSNYIYINPIPGAVNYEYVFTDQATGATISKLRNNGNPWLRLLWVAGLQYGKTYDVTVRFQVGTSWSDFGPSCEVDMLNAVPTTNLMVSYCNLSGLDLDSYIYNVAVAGADDYEYQFTNTTTGAVVTKLRGNSNNWMRLKWVNCLAYGTSYSVRVRALVNGIWGAYGSACSITLRPGTTKLTTQYCGTNGITLTDYIYIDPLPEAEDFEFVFTSQTDGTVYTRLRGNGNPWLRLSWVAGLQNGTSYNVIVRAKVCGIWYPYGAMCQIHLSPAGHAPEFMNNEESGNLNTDSKVSIYPNPTNGIINIAVGNNTESTVQIYNASGQLLLDRNVNSGNVTFDLSEYAKGIYFVRVESAGKIHFEKIIISD